MNYVGLSLKLYDADSLKLLAQIPGSKNAERRSDKIFDVTSVPPDVVGQMPANLDTETRDEILGLIAAVLSDVVQRWTYTGSQ